MFTFPICQFSGAVAGPSYPAGLSGLILWLDGSDASTITASGGAVSRWADKSGAGNHALQATGGNKPASGSATINSLNAIAFNATSSYLSLTNPINPVGTSGFAVASYVDLTGAGPILGAINAGSFWGVLNSGLTYFLVGSTDGDSASVLGDTSARAYGYTNASSGGSPSTLYIDGTTRSGGSNNALGAGSQFDTLGHRGTGEWFNGAMGEVLIYNRVLNSTEIGLLHAYLAAKWGTT